MSEMAVTRPAMVDEIREIFKTLRRRIVTREIPLGTRLREQDLASEFQVSRARIRDVLALLEQRELVSRQPNRGVVVRRYSLDELIKRFEIVECLSGLATRLATQRSTPSKWQAWLDLFEGPMEILLEDGKLHEYLANISRLQLEIAEAAGNEPLRDLISQYTDMLGPYIQKVLVVSDHARLAVHQHTAVLEAMVQGNADSAELLRRVQLRSSRQTLERFHDLLL